MSNPGQDVRQTRSRKGAPSGVFEAVGGEAVCRRLSERFHERVAGDPVLRPLFPKDMAPTTEYLALYLVERLGGPAAYTARRGKTSLGCRHAHLAIGAGEADQWLGHMFAAMEEVGMPADAAEWLRGDFRQTAAALSDALLPIYHVPLDELRRLLRDDAGLARAGDHGRTLLRSAAGEWDLPRVALLLEHGADVRARDVLGHDPLYRAANAAFPGREGEGCAVVAALVRHGADVRAVSGPGRLTALHAAARRGTVAIADELLAAGADIEAKDAGGETPLRRAVNCGQEAMVRALVAHGADPRSADRRGRTPLDAARTDRIREALRAPGRR